MIHPSLFISDALPVAVADDLVVLYLIVLVELASIEGDPDVVLGYDIDEVS